MRKRAKKFTITSLLLLLASPAFAAFISFGVNGAGGGGGGDDPTLGVLPSYNDAYANWSVAGLQSVGGISAIDATRTNCTTAQAGETMPLAPSGLTPPTTGDDSDRIAQAIANCPTSSIVQLTSGTFSLDLGEQVWLNRSSVTLRGGTCAGSTPHAYCQTIITKRNGLLPYHLDPTCGVDTSHEVTCQGFPVILMSAGGRFNNDWSGCHDNVTGGTQDGNTCTGHVAALTIDAAKGDTTVTVGSTTGFSVGQWVLIDEDPGAGWVTDPVNRGTVSPTVWASPDMFSSSGSPATGRIAYLFFNPNPGYGDTTAGGPGTCNGSGCPGAEGEACAYAATCFRPVGEIHLITAIDTGTKQITFDSPLTVAMRQSGSHAAHIYYPTAQASATYVPMLQYSFVENMSVGRGDDSDIQIIQCAYCGVKTVDAWGWSGGAVEIIGSVRTQVEDTYGYDCYTAQNNGTEYVFDLKAATTEALLVNIISRAGGKNMTARAGGAGSVVAYSYMDDPFYEFDSSLGNPGTNWIDASLNASHFPGSHHVLFEGDWAVNFGADMTHGSGANYMTYFRNHANGYRTPYTDPSNSVAVNDFTNTPKAPGNLRAIMVNSYNYWHAYVGNDLGAAGSSTTGNGWVYKGAYTAGSDKNIWETVDEYTQDSRLDPHLNFTNSASYVFKHGNFDSVDGSIADWTAGFSHTLPNSFFLNSVPSFFSAGASCSYPWPWVTPTAGSPLQSANGPGSCSTTSGLPAKARYDAGTPFVQP